MTARTSRDIPAPATRGFDRSALERDDPDLLERLRRDAATRVLVVHGDAAQIDAGVLRTRSAAEAPEGGRWAFLGRDEQGRPVLLAAFDADEAQQDGPGWAPLRIAAAELAGGDGEMLGTAVSLGRWLHGADFCPVCGERMRLTTGGWARLCDGCGREQFPRTDPAVIVAVESSSDADRLLLGSNALWNSDRYSCFAGFVEAGESLEGAVVRELREEAGVEVEDVRYQGSQPWPYPRSLMLGFRARATDDAQARADGDEIAALRWFTRDEIGQALSDPSSVDFVLPGRSSIAYRLIADWHAETM
jgi:NAD+ diphosphatase